MVQLVDDRAAGRAAPPTVAGRLRPLASRRPSTQVQAGPGHRGAPAGRRPRPGDRRGARRWSAARRRPRRSSRSRASGRSSVCSTNEPRGRDLHLAPRHPPAAGRREEAPAQAPLHLHQVAASATPATDRAGRFVHTTQSSASTVTRDARRRRPAHDHPELPQLGRRSAAPAPRPAGTSGPTRVTSLTSSGLCSRCVDIAVTSWRASLGAATDDHAASRRTDLWTTPVPYAAAVGRQSGPERAPQHARKCTEGATVRWPLLQKMFGGVLLSHILSGAVPLALAGLTSGFGMGPGVSLPLWPP